MRVFFLSGGNVCYNDGGRDHTLTCGAIVNYKKNIDEIKERSEWKRTGAGAAFAGNNPQLPGSEDIYAGIEAFIFADKSKILYSAALEENCGIFTRDVNLTHESEGYIIRKNGMWIYSMDLHPESDEIIVSLGTSSKERHIALCNQSSSKLDILTEGSSIDTNPTFSRQNPDYVYYSYAGLFVDPANGAAHKSHYGINCLNIKTGTLEEVCASEEFDYIRPLQQSDGSLYFIRRPYDPDAGNKTSIKDILLGPLKLLRAIGGWLNFFTIIYGGETIQKRSRGINPSQFSNKSAKDVFVDENLLKVEREFKQRSMKGESHKGIIPKNWELVRRNTAGETEVLCQGVLDYTIQENGGIYYSNGRYIMYKGPDNEEKPICKARLATNIRVTE